ncbi:uncharacterized protein BDW43DRAFT_308299 [Aspergillus alliaceus]|uniref:uncharacterized protein n=1 Tax=Petromyces alliaceus TaxID=209559 RepID=UPI0012A4DD15|nr:uncharacterized protein BDW43DRAFT_308299 [Aspergillus alliaceus]KAB8236622.1 hypothetical protein BDW43DRAFT_308299 [Aspergillus alliaceus]
MGPRPRAQRRPSPQYPELFVVIPSRPDIHKEYEKKATEKRAITEEPERVMKALEEPQESNEIVPGAEAGEPRRELEQGLDIVAPPASEEQQPQTMATCNDLKPMHHVNHPKHRSNYGPIAYQSPRNRRSPMPPLIRH